MLKKERAFHALGIISWILSTAGLSPLSFLPASITYLGARHGNWTRAFFFVENYYSLIGSFIINFAALIVALAVDVGDVLYYILIVKACIGFTGTILHLGLRKLAMDYAVEMLE